jgi:CxxC-x17-CxxC domain-containing protein
MAGITGESIPCAQCGELFVFSSAERAFYDSKGLVPPKRCKSCRAARAARAAGKSADRTDRTDPTERADVRASWVPPPLGDRPSWEATCSGCGAAASVPFEPKAGREVFCSRCWRGRRDLLRTPRLQPQSKGVGNAVGNAAGESAAGRGLPLDAADTDAEREVGMPAIIE